MKVLLRNWCHGSALLSVVMMFVAFAAMPVQADFCWRDSYGRGVGTVPKACADSNRAMDEGLCYNKCKSGWDGKATVCYQNCPSGFRDDGLLCAKPAAYTVGAGYPWKFGDPVGNYDRARDRCRADHPEGCEKSGLIWYPNCRSGFKKVGGLTCSPECPGGFTDIGVSCGKPSESRGAGVIPNQCESGHQLDAGLCYSNCRAKFDGVGPVCWQQCPASAPVNCGAGCAATKDECAEAITDQVVSVLDTIATVTTTVLSFGAGTAAKTAATTAAKATVKNAAKGGIKNMSKAQIKALIQKQARKAGKELAEAELENLAKAQMGDDFDFESLDPTGIASIVKAYNKPVCRAT
jgi:hypothetical protein